MATLIRRRGGPRPAPDAMTLSEHLGELRKRLIVSVIAFVVAAIVAYVFYPQILRFFERPYCATVPKGHACSLYVTGPLEAFGIRLNVTAYGGLVLASPVILYQLWKFVTPGLKANEKKYAIPFVVATLTLFCFGAFVAWLTFPHALGFLHAVGGPGITDIFSPSKYLSLIMALMAIFGLTFEFPVVLISLELANVLTPAKLRKWRRPAIVAIVVVSAVVTPSSDPFSMLALAVPMLVFYEASIVIGKMFKK
jgi:sec-independent protein translocase protein TatC